MASSGEKSLAVGHIPGFQIDPKETLNKSSSAGGESFAASFRRFIRSFLKKAKTSAGVPAVQIDIRLILWQMRDRPETGDTHSCSAEQGNPVQNRNTAGRPVVL